MGRWHAEVSSPLLRPQLSAASCCAAVRSAEVGFTAKTGRFVEDGSPEEAKRQRTQGPGYAAKNAGYPLRLSGAHTDQQGLPLDPQQVSSPLNSICPHCTCLMGSYRESQSTEIDSYKLTRSHHGRPRRMCGDEVSEDKASLRLLSSCAAYRCRVRRMHS